MAESINELLDQNEAAATQLLTEIQAAKDMIHHVNHTFFEPMKFQVFQGSGKHMVESMDEVAERLSTEAKEFVQYREKLSDHLQELEHHAEELSHRADAVEEQLTALWSALHESVNSLTEITNKKMEEAKAGTDSIIDIVRQVAEETMAHHQHTRVLQEHLYEKTDVSRSMLDELKQLHEEAVHKLNDDVSQHTQDAQDVMLEFMQEHREYYEGELAAIEQEAERVRQELHSHVVEETPKAVHTTIESVITGPLGDLVDAVTQGHETLGEKITEVLEKLGEVTQGVHEVRPTLDTIQSIN
jgi:prefoldin subunit 5